MRVAIAVGLLCFFAPSTLVSQTANHVVISEFATRGATATDEFVELYNPTESEIDLSGWKLQYKSQTGTGWFDRATIPSGKTIAAKGFFLISPSGYTGTTQADYSASEWSQGIADNGHVRIVNSSAQEIDKVGYGSGVVDPETAGAPNHGTSSNANSVERKARGSSTADSLAVGGNHEMLGNGYDSDNNANDFVVQNKGRNPQNSASPREPAGSILAGIGSAVMSPSVIKADTGIALSFIIRGTTQGTITRVKIPQQWPFDWSKASVQVLASGGGNGTVVWGTDTLIVDN
ncbi:MAG: lamin tail domain-containing protein, partial [Ignavibacteria bacterium]|nr:lamin tail domain-containing protein [Ignavibacteria bacterium]